MPEVVAGVRGSRSEDSVVARNTDSEPVPPHRRRGARRSRRSTPRHCRPCRTSRSRLGETNRPVRCPPAPGAGVPTETRPARIGHQLAPGRSSSPQPKTAPSSPPRAASSHSASVGSALRQFGYARRLQARCAPRDDRRSPLSLSGPRGWRQPAPGTYAHHRRGSLNSTGPAIWRKTSEPGTLKARPASGKSAGLGRALGEGDVPERREPRVVCHGD